MRHRWSISLLLAASLIGSSVVSAGEAEFRADWFVLDSSKIELSLWPYTRQIADVKASARLVNRSGVAIGAAIKGESTTIGRCTAQERATGLDVIWPDDLQKLREEAKAGQDASAALTYVPANGKANFTVTLICPGDADRFPRTTDLGLSFVIATKTQVVVVPVGESEVPVRILK